MTNDAPGCAWRHQLAVTVLLAVGCTSVTAAQTVVLPGTELLQNPYARAAVNLDGDWHVIPDPYENGYYNHRFEPRKDGYFLARQQKDPGELVEYDFRTSQVLQVPGDWNSQDDRFFFYEGTMWYFRSFDLQPAGDTRYLLYFGAANYYAEAWLNGEYLGEHEGGFTPFQFDVTEHLRPGENFVVVKVDNRREFDRVPTVNTDWWNYGGLTRSVRLVPLPRQHIMDYRIGLGEAGTVEGWVRVAGAPGAEVAVEIPALNARQRVKPDKAGIARFTLDAEPERWSPEHPRLYEVQFRYGSDKVEDRIGFRTIATRGDEILLNGEPVFLRGISLHESAPGREGRAYSEEDARTLLGWVRDLGCNFVRLAHYPHNEHMLRVADELGLMVWAEIPVYWTIDFESEVVFAKARQQLDEMIARDANRASVVLWSMANETPVGAPRTAFISKLAAHARRLDGSRLITAAMDTQSHGADRIRIEDPLASVIDVIGVNSYCGWYGGKPADCAALRWESAFDK
ncbi:MAG: glycoside hydrolase family 2 TIM barrel-domain containing protein, partial [Woeseiaceae bacterium]